METDGLEHADGRRGRVALTGKRLLGAVGTTTVLALAAGGLAAATSGGTAIPVPHPTAAAAKTAAAAATTQHPSSTHPWIRRLLRRTVHAQFVLRTKGGALETYDYDRGVLRSVTTTSIAIAPADAPTITVSATITSTTRFLGLTESQLQPGDRVALVYQGGSAVVVGARASRSTRTPSS